MGGGDQWQRKAGKIDRRKSYSRQLRRLGVASIGYQIFHQALEFVNIQISPMQSCGTEEQRISRRKNHCCCFSGVNEEESIGVDTGNLLIARPSCGEHSLSVVDTLVKSGSLDVIVVDSRWNPISLSLLLAVCSLHQLFDSGRMAHAPLGFICDEDSTIGHLQFSTIPAFYSYSNLIIRICCLTQSLVVEPHLILIVTQDCTISSLVAVAATVVAVIIIIVVSAVAAAAVAATDSQWMNSQYELDLSVGIAATFMPGLSSCGIWWCSILTSVVSASVAALVPQYELDNMIDLNGSELQSRLMKHGLRKVQQSLSRSRTVLVFVNQIRSNLKVFQDLGHASEATCGGNALKFYAAVRMRIMRKGLLKNEDEVTGINIIVQVVKNKLAPAMKKAELAIGFGKGIYHEAEVLELACKHGVICRAENGYFIDGQIFRDKLDAEQYLVENERVVADLADISQSAAGAPLLEISNLFVAAPALSNGDG
ncbi:hypothetical protein ACLOJK_000387 [Asimina triloba]